MQLDSKEEVFFALSPYYVGLTVKILDIRAKKNKTEEDISNLIRYKEDSRILGEIIEQCFEGEE